MDTREIARIVANNTARIDLRMWLQSEPYTVQHRVAVIDSRKNQAACKRLC